MAGARKPAPAPSPRKRLLLLALVVAGVGLVVWSAVRSDGAGPARGGARERQGGDAAKRAPRPPRKRIHGRVEGKDGGPIRRATVFVLKKSQAGGVRDDLPHEVTDEEGAWSLRVRTLEDRWLGAVAPGYRHAWLDGDEIDVSAPLVHVLELAPPLQVTVTDEAGAPIRGKGVQLETWPPRTTYFLPGPSARQGEQWQVTNRDGEATFRVGSEGAVVLRTHVEGHHLVGGPRWLAQPRGAVALRVRRNQSLHVAVTRGPDGAPAEGVVTVDFHDQATGALVLSFTDAVDEAGVLHLERAVQPGTYDLHVHADGCGSAMLRDVALDGPEPARADVRLPPACEPGTLAMTIDGIPPASGVPGRRRAPLVYVFRDEPVWNDHGWQPGAPSRWKRGTGALHLRLEPGRYHVLIADVLSRRAALVRDVVLASGARVTRDVPLRPGLRASVNALVAAGGRSRAVQIGAGPWPRLPVYGITADARIRVSNDRDLLGRVAEGEDVMLGPYPFDEIEIRVEQWDGPPHVHSARR